MPFPCQVSCARYTRISLPFPLTPSSSKTSPATALCSYFTPTSLDSILVSSLGHLIWGGDLSAVEPGAGPGEGFGCRMDFQVVRPASSVPWSPEGTGSDSLSQSSSVAHSCPTLCNPMDCSTPGFPVHRQLPEFTETHVR